MNRYVSEFLSLKCSGDVLNTVNPLGKNSAKEITESMAVIHKLKNLTIKNPMKYTLIDLCAGNALTSVIAVHLLPFKNAIAIDKKYRSRNWALTNRFDYIECNINDTTDIGNVIRMNFNNILISVHPCGELTEKIVNIFKLYYGLCKALIIMPCCKGKQHKKFPTLISEKLGSYIEWCYYIYSLLPEEYNNTITQHKEIISPCNVIIKSINEEQLKVGD